MALAHPKASGRLCTSCILLSARWQTFGWETNAASYIVACLFGALFSTSWNPDVIEVQAYFTDMGIITRTLPGSSASNRRSAALHVSTIDGNAALPTAVPGMPRDGSSMYKLSTHATSEGATPHSCPVIRSINDRQGECRQS